MRSAQHELRTFPSLSFSVLSLSLVFLLHPFPYTDYDFLVHNENKKEKKIEEQKTIPRTLRRENGLNFKLPKIMKLNTENSEPIRISPESELVKGPFRCEL